MIKDIFESVSNLNCDINRIVGNKYIFPNLSCLTVQPGKLSEDLNLSEYRELRHLKCNNGTLSVEGKVIVPKHCGNLECLRGSKLILPEQIRTLNIQNCSFKMPIDINHDYENILIECWDTPKQGVSTTNILNFSENAVCNYLYTEMCEINNFIIYPSVRECFCYHCVLNNIDFSRCNPKNFEFEFEDNIFCNPKIPRSGGFKLNDLVSKNKAR